MRKGFDKKCVCVYLYKVHRLLLHDVNSISINGQQLNFVSTFTYLGVDSELSMKTHRLNLCNV